MLENGRQGAGSAELLFLAHGGKYDLGEPQRATVGATDAGGAREGRRLLVFAQAVERVPGKRDDRRHHIPARGVGDEGGDVGGRREGRIALQVDDEVSIGRRNFGSGAAAVCARGEIGIGHHSLNADLAAVGADTVIIRGDEDGRAGRLASPARGVDRAGEHGDAVDRLQWFARQARRGVARGDDDDGLHHRLLKRDPTSAGRACG